MITISLCMIVRNEEQVLKRCLESIVNLVDEIIIVDTGSTDNSLEIASSYTSKVYPFTWIDDFSAARNYSFSKATMDYCMWLDADDVLEELQREKFLNVKKTLKKSTDIVMMKYNTAFDENDNPTFSYYRERLLKNNKHYVWKGAVHEAIVPVGNVIYSDVAISHKKICKVDSDRNLNIYRKQLEKNKVLEPRHQYYYARELYYHALYEEALNEFLAFMGTKDGWSENKIEACTLAAYCFYKLEKEEEALRMLLRSFEYDSPRAEVCCDIGKHFMDRSQYHQAIYWYEQALNRKLDNKRSGFILPECYDYIPSLQLCVCYDKLGNASMAEYYNDKAGEFKPNSKQYLINKNYFKQKKNNQIVI